MALKLIFLSLSDGFTSHIKREKKIVENCINITGSYFSCCLMAIHYNQFPFTSGGWLLVSSYVMQSSTPPSQLPLNTSLLGISSNQTFITTSVMKELRTYLNFTQVRFHCKKQGRNTFHIATALNSKGEAAVQYFSNQREDMPDSCGSYLRMSDDNSNLAKTCNRWGRENNNCFSGKWGIESLFYIHQLGLPENRLFDHPAFIYGESLWLLYLTNNWFCDDRHVGVSSGDFWKVFVR